MVKIITHIKRGPIGKWRDVDCHSDQQHIGQTWLIRMAHTVQWRHNGCDGVSNHQPHYSLLNRLFRRRSKKTSKLRVTCLCVRGIHRWPVNSPHIWPVTRTMFPFDDVIMFKAHLEIYGNPVHKNMWNGMEEKVHRVVKFSSLGAGLGWGQGVLIQGNKQEVSKMSW